ncbi:MAG: DUF423 domain-containing protein [Caulobacteraceae bacterium]
MERARIWAALAGVNGFMAVAAGAFGAHGVKDIDVKALLHTGSQYQAVHAVAALACLALLRGAAGPASWAAALFGFGGLVFGGSLYILAMSGVKLWGAVTPIGGLMLLAGWAVVIWGALTGQIGRRV